MKKKSINSVSRFAALILFTVLYSCTYDKETLPPPLEEETFIHISHTYVPYVTEQKVDSLVQQIPLSKYDIVMLGGDMAGNTTLNMSTTLFVDSIFDLSNPKTLWSIGNHDYDIPANAIAVSHKPLHYAYYHNGITFLVLDTQDSMSNFVGDQLDLIKKVTDTISESNHLVVLTHKLVWATDNGYMQSIIDTIANGQTGDCFWCINPNNFYADVYPRLLQVKNRGIKVLCVGGDLGYHHQTFTYTNSDGIPFIGAGLFSGHAINYCIVFHYVPANRELNYSFELLTDLAKY
ncbi:hypothetical protein BH11BAC1_BH11BAC1_24840 [soil metagenome]